MRIRWYGQGAFLLSGEKTVLIDPFGDLGDRVRYPAVTGVEADLLLVTHEHRDHNYVEAAINSPQTIRSTAGTFESPVGEVVGIASEHDDAAGTQRGPNTIFRFTLDGLRIAHFGDFGQPAMRPEQASALGAVDVLLLPAGGGPTIGGAPAAELVRAVAPRLVIPMHFRTPAIDFLDPPDDFLAALGARTDAVEGSELVAEEHLGSPAEPVVALLQPPVR